MEETRFLRRLLQAVPFVQADWDREQAFYQDNKSAGYFHPPTAGSFLIGLGFTTVHRWAAGGAPEADQLRALLAFLEAEAADPFIARFVGCLPDPGDQNDEVLKLLGPRLRELKDDQVRYDDESVSAAVVDFLHRMADEVPFLRQQVFEHFEEYRHPLAHVFVGGSVSWVCALYAAGHVDTVRPLLDFLEREFEQDPEVDNVIAVSFVEMLPFPGEPGAEIEHALGPKLRAELDRQRAWRPGPQ